jgi:hypothetical protein
MLERVLEERYGSMAWIAAGTVVAHVATGGQYGFHRDELMALGDARHLSWGYVTYPPMTPLVARMALILFGTSLVEFRFFSAVAHLRRRREDVSRNTPAVQELRRYERRLMVGAASGVRTYSLRGRRGTGDNRLPVVDAGSQPLRKLLNFSQLLIQVCRPHPLGELVDSLWNRLCQRRKFVGITLQLDRLGALLLDWTGNAHVRPVRRLFCLTDAGRNWSALPRGENRGELQENES